MRNNALPVIALLALSVAVANAQVESPSEPAVLDVENLTTALSDLAGRDTAFTGRVKIEDDSDSGGMGGVVMMGAGATNVEPFAGRFEAFSTRKGQLVIASKKKFPGFAIFDDGERRLTNVLYEDDAPGLSELENDLTRLADLEALASRARKLDWKVTAGQDGSATFRAKLPSRMLRGQSAGMFGMMQKKIMSVKAEIAMNVRSEIVSLSFEVLRSDPMASMREMAMEGGGTLEMSSESMDDMEDIEGKSHRYELKPASGVSKRLKSVIATMNEVIADEED